MKVLIIGGGKLGYYLTKTLMEEGHEVHLIEILREKCTKLADELDIPVVFGDGTLVETLKAAGVMHMDALISVTGKDEVNMIACQLGKRQFNVPKTIARTNNPKNIEVMNRLGADIALCSTSIIAGMIEHEVDSPEIKLVTNINQGEAEISEYMLPVNWSKSGRRLMDLNLPEDSVIVSLIRKGEMLIPRGKTQLFGGDEIMALTIGTARKQLMKIFEIV